MIQDILFQLIAGFQSALTFWNLAFVTLGVAIGILFGVLPGVGGVTALSIMVPVTFYMEAVTALGFLIGITKGGTSGGAIPAILLNAPGSSETWPRHGMATRSPRAANRSRRCAWRFIPRSSAMPAAMSC